MKLSDIATVIKEMTGRMPESSRALLALKFVKLLGKNLTNPKMGDSLKVWEKSGGVKQFFDDCDLKSGQPWVNHEISVHDSDLAAFLNRWMNVEQFKAGPGQEFQPITPDMNSIRSMMLNELQGIYNAQKRMNENDNQDRSDRDTGPDRESTGREV